MIDEPAVLWTVASGLGAVIAAWGSIEAFRDLRALQGYVNGRRMNAWRDLRNQTMRAIVQVAWFLLGLPLMFDERVTPWTPAVIVLVATNVALLVAASLDLRDRLRIMARVA